MKKNLKRNGGGTAQTKQAMQAQLREREKLHGKIMQRPTGNLESRGRGNDSDEDGESSDEGNDSPSHLRDQVVGLITEVEGDMASTGGKKAQAKQGIMGMKFMQRSLQKRREAALDDAKQLLRDLEQDGDDEGDGDADGGNGSTNNKAGSKKGQVDTEEAPASSGRRKFGGGTDAADDDTPTRVSHLHLCCDYVVVCTHLFGSVHPEQPRPLISRLKFACHQIQKKRKPSTNKSKEAQQLRSELGGGRLQTFSVEMGSGVSTEVAGDVTATKQSDKSDPSSWDAAVSGWFEEKDTSTTSSAAPQNDAESADKSSGSDATGPQTETGDDETSNPWMSGHHNRRKRSNRVAEDAANTDDVDSTNEVAQVVSRLAAGQAGKAKKTTKKKRKQSATTITSKPAPDGDKTSTTGADEVDDQASIVARAFASAYVYVHSGFGGQYSTTCWLYDGGHVSVPSLLTRKLVLLVFMCGNLAWIAVASRRRLKRKSNANSTRSCHRVKRRSHWLAGALGRGWGSVDFADPACCSNLQLLCPSQRLAIACGFYGHCFHPT